MPRRTTTRSPAVATETACPIVRHGCALVQLAASLPPGATNSVAADAHAGRPAQRGDRQTAASRTPRRTLLESFDIPNLHSSQATRGLDAANAASLLPSLAELNRHWRTARPISHAGSFGRFGCPHIRWTAARARTSLTSGRPTCPGVIELLPRSSQRATPARRVGCYGFALAAVFPRNDLSMKEGCMVGMTVFVGGGLVTRGLKRAGYCWRRWTRSTCSVASLGAVVEHQEDHVRRKRMFRARLDRLPWASWHSLVAVALGAVWILDGLEVPHQIVLGLPRSCKVRRLCPCRRHSWGARRSIYVAGAVCVFFFWCDLTHCSAGKCFLVYAWLVPGIATISTAFSQNFAEFAIARFFTGWVSGGEYSAINSAIDELIPARVRGWLGLAINGSFRIGTADLARPPLAGRPLNPKYFSIDVGWRVGFGIGAVLSIRHPAGSTIRSRSCAG